MTKLTDKILLEAEKKAIECPWGDYVSLIDLKEILKEVESKEAVSVDEVIKEAERLAEHVPAMNDMHLLITRLKDFIASKRSKEAVEDKEIKADGYVAWKPSGAFDQSFEVVKGDGSCLAGHKGEVVTDGMQYEYIEIYKTPYQVERFADPFRRKMTNEGWQIRPVKLVFLDTAKESGEKG